MTGHTLEPREHLAGCPQVLRPERGVRVESYVLTRPPQTHPEYGHVVGPPQPVRVTRCLDCGESRYEEIDREEPR